MIWRVASVVLLMVCVLLVYEMLDMSLHLSDQKVAADEWHSDLRVAVGALNLSIAAASYQAKVQTLNHLRKQNLTRLIVCERGGEVWVESYDWIELTGETCSRPSTIGAQFQPEPRNNENEAVTSSVEFVIDVGGLGHASQRAIDGDAAASMQVSRHYLLGENDLENGFFWLRLGAEQGDCEAQEHLFRVYERRADLRDGTKLAEEWRQRMRNNPLCG